MHTATIARIASSSAAKSLVCPSHPRSARARFGAASPSAWRIQRARCPDLGGTGGREAPDEGGQLIRELDARMRKVTTPALRFDVELGAESPSNFFVGVAGDVVEGGGVFVATYAKLPPLGSRVTLALSLPAGGQAEVEGTVEWTQDQLGEGAPPGFGVRITEADETSRELIRRFASIREPLLRE